MRSNRAAVLIGLAALFGVACGGSSSDSTPTPTKQYKLTVTKAGAQKDNGTVTGSGLACGATCSVTVDEGTKVTLTAATTAGAAFTGFSGDCTATTKTCVVTVGADKAVTATFDLAKVSLRVFAWGGGTVKPDPGVYAYDYGATVTLTATTPSGVTFTGWSGAASGKTDTVVVTLDGSKLVGARFFDPTATSKLPVPATLSTAGQTVGALKVLDWAGYQAAVSYTFDDSAPTQLANYAAMHETGTPMTFYAIPQNMAAHLSDWKTILNDGNEFGVHTLNHCHVSTDGVLSGCSYNDTPVGANTTGTLQIDGTVAYLQGTLGQKGVFSMASPFGDANWDAYAAAAGILLQRDVYGATIASGDITKQDNLPVYMYGDEYGGIGSTLKTITDKIDAAETAKAWSLFLFHGIATPLASGEADTVTCCAVPPQNIVDSMNYLKGKGDVWAGTVTDVGSYWIGQYLVTHATATTSGGATVYTWTLPPNFAPGKFVRVTVDGATLSQGGVDLVKAAGGYYDVALDAGALTVTTAATPSALKIVGAVGTNPNNGEHGLSVMFTIPATDLTAGTWTVSYEYFKPTATPASFNTQQQAVFNLGSGAYTQAAWYLYDGWDNAWHGVTYTLGTPDAGSKFAGATWFWIHLPYEKPDPNAKPAVVGVPDGTPVTWYLRNIVITDGAGGHAPLNLQVTTATDPSVASVSTGTGTVSIGMP